MPAKIEGLDQNEVNEIVQLVYNKWSTEYGNLKLAKEMKWDGKVCPKAEWPETHRRMVSNNSKREAEAKRLLDQVKHLAKFGE